MVELGMCDGLQSLEVGIFRCDADIGLIFMVIRLEILRFEENDE